LAIPLTGKVVARLLLMAMPLFVMVTLGHAHAHTGERQESPAVATDRAMKTYQEWLPMQEGLWMNDRNAVIGLSRLNPLPKDSAANKSLPKAAKAMPFKPKRTATFKPYSFS